MAQFNAAQILADLKRSVRAFSLDRTEFSTSPGIYAVFFVSNEFPKSCVDVKPHELLYVGKTESSQVSRDHNTHFADGKTGSSTLRRTLGALLRVELGLKPQPRSESEQSDKRFKNYKFDPEGERALTEWMRESLGLSFFEMSTATRAEIKQLERKLISLACPILNLAENSANAHGVAVRAARKACADLARGAECDKPRRKQAAVKAAVVIKTVERANAAMFLHAAIAEVLRGRPGRTATAREIAREIEERDLYRQKAGTPAPASQILLRARKRPSLFEVVPSQRIRLR